MNARARAAAVDGPAYSAELGHVHSMLNDDYWGAMFRANYYRWAAGRRFVGRDPLDGREHKYDPIHVKAERVASVAQARYWLGHAASLRERMRREVLP